MSHNSDGKPSRLQLPKPVDVPTSAGTVRVLTFGSTALNEVLNSAGDDVSDEELGRRLLVACLRAIDGAPLTDGVVSSLTEADLDALAEAAMRNWRLPPGAVPNPPIAALGSAARVTDRSVAGAFAELKAKDSRPGLLAAIEAAQMSTGSAALQAAAEAAKKSTGFSALQAAAAEAAQRNTGFSALQAAAETAQNSNSAAALMAAVEKAGRFDAARAYASLPEGVVLKINEHSAALDKASESLRTSAAAFIKSDQESQERFKAILKQADPLADGVRSRREGEFSIDEPPLVARQPALEHLREQTALARKGVQATTETAQRTAVMAAHMATVVSEISSLSQVVMTEALPSWRQSDLDNRRSANRSLRLAVGALIATVVLTGVQIWLSRVDRAEDLKRLAADAAQSEQRARAAEARQQHAEREAAALRELLQQALRERQGTASAAPPRPAVQGRGSPKRTP